MPDYLLAQHSMVRGLIAPSMDAVAQVASSNVLLH